MRTRVAVASLAISVCGAVAPAMAGGSGAKPAVAPADASAGAPVVTGSLGKDAIRRVIREHSREVRFCYEKELLRKPELTGRLTVAFVISPEGTVSSATLRDSTLAVPALEECVTSAVKRWVFPKPAGGGIVSVIYPFRFEVDGPEPAAESAPRGTGGIIGILKARRGDRPGVEGAGGAAECGRYGTWSSEVRASIGVDTLEADRPLFRHLCARLDPVLACYEKERVRAPELAYSIDLVFTVGPKGAASAVGVDYESESRPALAACLVGALRKIAFPRVAGPAVTRVLGLDLDPPVGP